MKEKLTLWHHSFKNSKYDQEIKQSQTANKPMATQQSRDTRKTNKS